MCPLFRPLPACRRPSSVGITGNSQTPSNSPLKHCIFQIYMPAFDTLLPKSGWLLLTLYISIFFRTENVIRLHPYYTHVFNIAYTNIHFKYSLNIQKWKENYISISNHWLKIRNKGNQASENKSITHARICWNYCIKNGINLLLKLKV